jgi:hypothetical protein
VISLLIFFTNANATKINGTVVDQFNNPLGFCSITVKESNKTVLSNDQGKFYLDLPKGKYQFVLQHVGYETMVIDKMVEGDELHLTITMKNTTLTLAEVRVKAGGEDPAYEIIRNAIKQRKFYQTQVGTYTCEAYLKGLIRTVNFPDNFLGQPVDFEDGDSSKNKIIFLSESISDIAFRQPDDLRVVVKS